MKNRNERFVSFIGKGMIVALLLLLFTVSGRPVSAAEGGASSYTPGSQGDFALCYYPPGLYFRENIVYNYSTLKNYHNLTPGPLFGKQIPIDAKLDAKVWFSLLQVLYTAESSFLGGHYFANVNIPVGISAELDVEVTSPVLPRRGVLMEESTTTSGLGDIQVVPLGIVWDFHDMHFLIAQNFVLDTGRYNVKKTNNMGRNYFSFDEVAGFTWLDQEGGHEVSLMAGYMINTRNQATDYRTGDEFHLDYTLAQYFSPEFGLGVVGYYYEQVTDDDSPYLDDINTINASRGLPTSGGFRSKGAGVGPAVFFSKKIGSTEVSLIAKWINEYYARNRFEGDWVWLSAVVKF